MGEIQKGEFNTNNALVNKFLCAFIYDKFIKNPKNSDGAVISQNQYAILCGLSSSTLTKLKLPEGYDIPISTIYSICRHEKYSLQKFFKEFEKKYGFNIPQ